jgi:hypothetical protein
LLPSPKSLNDLVVILIIWFRKKMLLGDFKKGKLGGSFKSKLFLGLGQSTILSIPYFVEAALIDSAVKYLPAA